MRSVIELSCKYPLVILNEKSYAFSTTRMHSGICTLNETCLKSLDTIIYFLFQVCTSYFMQH